MYQIEGQGWWIEKTKVEYQWMEEWMRVFRKTIQRYLTVYESGFPFNQETLGTTPTPPRDNGATCAQMIVFVRCLINAATTHFILCVCWGGGSAAAAAVPDALGYTCFLGVTANTRILLARLPPKLPC